jgi:hypothetical protein
MRLVGHAACLGSKGMTAYRILVGKPEGKRPPGRLHIGERIILKWI